MPLVKAGSYIEFYTDASEATTLILADYLAPESRFAHVGVTEIGAFFGSVRAHAPEDAFALLGRGLEPLVPAGRG